MKQYIIGRICLLAISITIAAIFIFFVLRLLPGDAAGTTLGVGTTGAQNAQLRQELGLDKPVINQFTAWIANIFQGDLGMSFVSRLPVSQMIGSRLGVTIPLSLLAFILSILVSIPLGVMAALQREKKTGIILSALTQVGIAVPVFWVGVLLITVFALQLNWLPVGGFPRTGWKDPITGLQALLLPAVTIAVAMSAVIIRYVRSATLDVANTDYIRTSLSLGYSLRQALWRHGVRNGAVPVMAILGIEFSTSLLGAVIVENVFALPGLGMLLLEGVNARDLPVVQTLVLLLTGLVLLVNFGVDLAQRIVDPRLCGKVLDR